MVAYGQGYGCRQEPASRRPHRPPAPCRRGGSRTAHQARARFVRSTNRPTSHPPFRRGGSRTAHHARTPPLASSSLARGHPHVSLNDLPVALSAWRAFARSSARLVGRSTGRVLVLARVRAVVRMSHRTARIRRWVVRMWLQGFPGRHLLDRRDIHAIADQHRNGNRRAHGAGHRSGLLHGKRDAVGRTVSATLSG
jgi:hypothetical protein